MSLVVVDAVTKRFAARHKQGDPVTAVDDVSLKIEQGQTVGLIGESGSGKSTLARVILRLLEPDSGTITVAGKNIGDLPPKQMRELRSNMQVVFQEPFESLNPRMRIGDIIAEPLRIHQPQLTSQQRQQRIGEALEQVGLSGAVSNRRPAELSGGQQQRVGIARAIVTRPFFIVLDEPTSSLDLSIRAQIIQLLSTLQRELGLTYLFISHDIFTIRYMSQQVLVMYLGRIVERGPTESIFADPRHPYTRALLSARLSPDPEEQLSQLHLLGEIGRTSRPDGCVLYGRCPIGTQECTVGPIPFAQITSGHEAACLKAYKGNDPS